MVPGKLERPSKDCLCSPSPECPLTMSAQLEFCAEMIKALKNGGAHLDFRTREGMTALHKAVRCRNHTALRVSLSRAGAGSPQGWGHRRCSGHSAQPGQVALLSRVPARPSLDRAGIVGAAQRAKDSQAAPRR